MNDQKEMKLLLDMYKGVSKEQRDKVQLMAAEKKTRAELEDARQQLKKIQVQYSAVTQMAVDNM
jgi:E3 ubiquitin-protein ligase BRE1